MIEAPHRPTWFLVGCTGQIGSRLVETAKTQARLIVLSRNPDSAKKRWENAQDIEWIQGDATQPGKWQSIAAEADAVVNLLGESILSSRWNASFKKTLLRTRVDSTLRLGEALVQAPKPRVWVNASAIGFYGSQGPCVSDEDDPPGSDFLAQLAKEWEAALWAHSLGETRKIALRIGIVLDPKAGALPRMALPFRLFVGSRIGWDRFDMSWIHHRDLTGLILHGLKEPTVEGPMNATAPQPVTNAQMAEALAKALHRPNLIPVPRLALRILLGEAAEAVTRGRPVLPAKALKTGYRFLFPDINSALADLLAS